MDSNVLIRVFDTDLNYLGQVDDYESLIFRRKWSGYGEFEITLGYCSRFFRRGDLSCWMKTRRGAAVSNMCSTMRRRGRIR